MPSTKTVWGIDVGQCALKALKLQHRDGKLRALAFDVIDHAKILSQPDADEQALIRSALAKFLSRNSIKGSTLVISVPGQASFTRFIKLPPVEMRKIPEIVQYEARQQIPFNLEDVVWDYQTISPPSAGPREVEVGIFAMKRDIVNDYVSDFLAMKIEPDIVQMAPVALYNYLRYEKTEGGGATVLIDVGAENTNLVISDGDRVWIRNVPIGGNNFTQALCQEFNLPFSKAENLKRHAAESKHARKVFQAMRPVFGDLLTEIQRSIGYYTSLHRDSRVERVIALGNACRLPGLTKFISQNLGVDVNRVEGFSALSDSEALSAPLFKDNVLAFGVPFGLALQGLGQASIATSLLPPEILSSKIMKKKRPFFVAAGVALLGAVACFAYDQMATNGELAGRSGEVRALDATVSKIQKGSAAQQGEFDKQKEALVKQQESINELEGLVDDAAFGYQVMRTVWDAWPQDKNWEMYDPNADAPPRSTLKVIELLTIKVHYVPDVRTYSDQAKAPGGVAAISVAGAPPPPPVEEGAKPTSRRDIGGVPGVLVEIEGITPQKSRQGQTFVSGSLMAGLKECKRTVRLLTPAGEEVLAKMPLTGVFRNNPQYADYARAGKKDEKPLIDRGDDFWFKAQWVVGTGALSEPQRIEVFRQLGAATAAAGAADPRQFDSATGLGAQEAGKLKTEVETIIKNWLISKDDLAKIAAEGKTKEWATGAPPPPPPPE